MILPWRAAFFLAPASASPSSAGSPARRVPAPARSAVARSSPGPAGCPRHDPDGSGPRTPARSASPPSGPSTARWRSPALPDHASVLVPPAADPPGSGGVSVLPAPPSSDWPGLLRPAAWPSGSPTDGEPRVAGRLQTGSVPCAGAAPPATAVSPQLQSHVARRVGFPCAHDTTESSKCHYIIRSSIGPNGTTRSNPSAFCSDTSPNGSGCIGCSFELLPTASNSLITWRDTSD